MKNFTSSQFQNDPDPYWTLLMAVYVMALRDLRRGDESAEAFLWSALPEQYARELILGE
ncbi:MAG TPA: hypothetical protein VGW38_22645 [Chloroflexota bacterium]|nr:hypothetical protein [Chloroflexota bacterium]